MVNIELLGLYPSIFDSIEGENGIFEITAFQITSNKGPIFIDGEEKIRYI